MVSLSTMFRRLVPMFDRVLVRKLEPITQTKSGVLLPEKSSRPTTGTVVEVGPGHRNKRGDFLPIELNVGDEVVIPEFGGVKVEIDEQEHFIFKESDLLAKIEN